MALPKAASQFWHHSMTKSIIIVKFKKVNRFGWVMMNLNGTDCSRDVEAPSPTFSVTMGNGSVPSSKEGVKRWITY